MGHIPWLNNQKVIQIPAFVSLLLGESSHVSHSMVMNWRRKSPCDDGRSLVKKNLWIFLGYSYHIFLPYIIYIHIYILTILWIFLQFWPFWSVVSTILKIYKNGKDDIPYIMENEKQMKRYSYTGWWLTYPSENMSSSGGTMTFPTEWKTQKLMFQTTNQLQLWPLVVHAKNSMGLYLP